MRRGMIEALKFMTGKELMGLTGICRRWEEALQAEELWLALLPQSAIEVWKSLRAQGSSPLRTYCRLYGKYVAVVQVNHLFIYRYHTHHWEVQSLPITPTETAILTPLQPGELLCIGPMHPTDTFKIHICTGFSQPLHSRFEYRDFSGVCKIENFVYSFAGKNSRLCEKLDLNTGRWERVGQCLHPRHAFNPAAVAQFVYLAHGNSPTVERFHTVLMSFTEVKVKLKMDTSVAAVIYEGRLVGIGLHKVCEWDIKSGEEKSRQLPLRPLRAWSSCQPVLEANRVVLAWSYSGFCGAAVLDLQSWRWEWSEAPSLK